MPRVVSFDVAGTLIDFHYFKHVWNKVIPELYAAKKSLDFEEAKNYVLKEYSLVGRDDIRWHLIEYWFKHFSLEEDPLRVAKSQSDEIRFYPEVFSVTQNLSRKYDLIIASGIPRNMNEIITKNLTFFKKIFSPVTDLNEVAKTPKFYNMICTVLGVKPQAIVHVGDDWCSDFIAPRKIGIKTILLDRTQEKNGKNVIWNLRELEKVL